MSDADELARRREERARHPSTLPPIPAEDLPRLQPDESFTQRIDDLPSVVRARLDALQNVAAEVADELADRGLDELAERLRGALP